MIPPLLSPATIRSSASLRRRAAAFAGALALLPALGSAVTVAGFTEGNGTATSDQWTGTIGNGWATAWQQAGADLATGVVNTAPLHAGGNYLQFDDNDATAAAYIRRQMVNFGEVNLSQPYQLTLSYRFDGSLAQLTTFNDRIAIFGDSTAMTGTGATNTWGLGVVGADNSPSQTVFPGEWYFYDNNGSSAFTSTNMFDTNLALVAGRTYAITVDVNPVAGTYDASIDDGVNPVVSAIGLTFRNGATNTSASWFHISHNASAGTDDSAFSVDNIAVVPEPASASLLLGSLGLLLARRRVAG